MQVVSASYSVICFCVMCVSVYVMHTLDIWNDHEISHISKPCVKKPDWPTKPCPRSNAEATVAEPLATCHLW
jgi:hypothetical protein